MNVLHGIQNFLQFINDNWVTISAIIGLIVAICAKVKSYLKLSKEEKIAIAKKQIRETMLRFVTDAEESYSEWKKAGSIKRAQVIEEIFVMYPILSKVTNQEELIAWLDEIIDEALEKMRKIFAEQLAEETTDTE